MSKTNTQNPLVKRLDSIRDVLMNYHSGGSSLSNSTKGTEREIFARAFLSQVFPKHYRFSSGDIIDTHNNQTGQVDIVAEYPDSISFPMYPDAPRLFMAETVAAVIEVKSNISDQWDQAVETARKVKEIRRLFARQEIIRDYEMLKNAAEEKDDPEMRQAAQRKKSELKALKNEATEKIPFYLVGYEGPKEADTLKRKLRDQKSIDAVFLIDSRSFHWRNVDGKVGVSNGFQSFITFLEHLKRDFRKVSYIYRGLDWNYLQACHKVPEKYEETAA